MSAEAPENNVSSAKIPSVKIADTSTEPTTFLSGYLNKEKVTMLPGDIGREKNKAHIEMARMAPREIYSDKKNCHE